MLSTNSPLLSVRALLFSAIFGVAACEGASGDSAPGDDASGGTPGDADEGTGGRSPGNGGAQASGGSPSSGGTAPAVGGGDNSTGGSPEGGNAGAGGSSDAGGGSDAGGSAAGGDSSAGGNGPNTGGASSTDFSYLLGADISGVEEDEDKGTTFVDTDGQTKSLLDLLKNHGFNAIRLRTFVEPTAAYGYASTENDCVGLSEAYGDQAHVIAQGKKVKDAGMHFLLNFHYSDVWADPGNQIIPEAWRGATTIDALADLLSSYTTDFITAAIAAGARPDMVQIGNEISPGMLMHEPGPSTDCWGNDPAAHSPSGSTANWDNLALLLKAGIDAVRAIDPTIQIMLHTENTADLAGVRWWLENATSRGVDFDVMGLSAYAAFQGPPSTWRNTFETMADEFPQLSFVVAEYNPERTAANQIMLDLPGGRGLGTYFWEPTRGGEWGDAMFTWQGNTLVANEADFAEYDQIRTLVGL